MLFELKDCIQQYAVCRCAVSHPERGIRISSSWEVAKSQHAVIVDMNISCLVKRESTFASNHQGILLQASQYDDPAQYIEP